MRDPARILKNPNGVIMEVEGDSWNLLDFWPEGFF